MESQLLEELVNLSRRQARLLEEIRELLEELRAGEGGAVTFGGVAKDPRDLA